MTIDLLKQLETVCKQGIKEGSSIEERTYYKELYQNIQKTIELINREPAIG